MSVSLYEYNPKYCDREPCPGDCDLCNKWQEFPEEKTMKISLTDFINILFDKEIQKQFLKECEELGITNDDSKGADDE